MINISYLQECLLCEVMIDNIRGCIALIYRSPSQNSLEFQHFLSGFEQLLINIEGFKPNFTVLLGDYNAGLAWKKKTGVWSPLASFYPRQVVNYS